MLMPQLFGDGVDSSGMEVRTGVVDVWVWIWERDRGGLDWGLSSRLRVYKIYLQIWLRGHRVCGKDIGASPEVSPFGSKNCLDLNFGLGNVLGTLCIHHWTTSAISPRLSLSSLSLCLCQHL